MPNRPRISRGDAQAVLQAFGGGGLTIQRGQPPVKVGAPADAAGLATIRPISGEGFDGKHYCALDWHVVVLGLFYPSTIFTRDEATADAKMSPITLTLDGVVLDTTRTPLRSAPALPGHYLQEGRVMGPDELSVGSHVLKGDMGNPGFPFHDQITFVIDAPGTGTCSYPSGQRVS